MNDNDVDRVDRIRRAADRQGLMLTGRLPTEADSDGYALVDTCGAWTYGTLDDMEDYLIDLGEVISDDDEPVADDAAGHLARQSDANLARRLALNNEDERFQALRDRIKGYHGG